MVGPGAHDVTQLLRAAGRGTKTAVDELLPVVYDQLHDLAARRVGSKASRQDLSPTALVHEAYVRLVGGKSVSWQDRTHFFAVAATAMRQVLVDYARRRGASKRGGDRQRVTLEVLNPPGQTRGTTVYALHEALDKLAQMDERKARVIELRFFAGLSIAETAAVLGTSHATVERDWHTARAWLFHEIEGEGWDDA